MCQIDKVRTPLIITKHSHVVFFYKTHLQNFHICLSLHYLNNHELYTQTKPSNVMYASKFKLQFGQLCIAGMQKIVSEIHTTHLAYDPFKL